MTEQNPKWPLPNLGGNAVIALPKDPLNDHAFLIGGTEVKASDIFF